MLKPYSKFKKYMFKSLKVILTLTYHYFPVPSECFSSLVQAVTSQAENCEHLKEVLIEWLFVYLFEFDVFRINKVNAM